MPSAVRTARSASKTGFSAATSSFATSATAAISPAGGDDSVSFGIRSRSSERDRRLLQIAVGHQQDRPVRRSQRDLIGAHRGLGEVRQRDRQIVPLGVIAHHRDRILRAVIPLDSRPPRGGVDGVPKNDVSGRPRGVRVINRHRRVLQSDRAVGHHGQRLAFDPWRSHRPSRPTALHGSR